MSGQSSATFGNATQAATAVTFAEPDSYVLRLSASNALVQTSRDLAVIVSPFTWPQVCRAAVSSGRIQFQVSGATG